MIKLDELRRHLLNSVPALRESPERLLTFIERGAIRFARGPHLSHEYQVPARIVITDFAGSLDVITIPMLQWLSHYQPDLDEDAIRFDAELLSTDRWDIAIEVTLTERVIAKVNCNTGAIDVEHRMPKYPLDACPPRRWQLSVKGPGDDEHQAVAEWDQNSEQSSRS